MPLSCDLNRGSVASFSAHADPLLVISASPHGRRTAGADPVISPVMFFLLFLNPFIKHLQQLIQFPEKVIAAFIVDVPFPLAVAEPVPELRRQIFRSLHVFKVFGKHRVKPVVIRFRLDDNAAAQIVKPGQGRLRQPLVQSLYKRHPLVNGNLKAFCPEQIKKF